MSGFGPTDAEIIELGKSCVAWLTSDPDDAAHLTVVEAWLAIKETIRVGEERNDELKRMQSLKGKAFHHINGNIYDNRAENLRLVDVKER